MITIKKLLERIYDEDIKKKPPLGSNPFISSIISDQITTKLSIEQIEFQNPVFEGKHPLTIRGIVVHIL